MKSTITALLLTLVATTAAADPSYSIAPPSGWKESVDTAKSIAVYSGSDSLFGGLPSSTAVVAFVKPRVGSLIVTHARAKEQSANIPGGVRAALDAVRLNPLAVGDPDGDVRVVSWTEKLADNIAEGALEWRHQGNQTTTLSRVMIFSDGAGLLHSVAAECIVSDDAERPTCETALASMSVTGLKSDRGVIGELLPPTSAPSPVDDAAIDDNSSTATGGAAATSAPTKPSGVLFAGPGQQRRSYWLYLGAGAGALLLALFFALRRKSTSEEN